MKDEHTLISGRTHCVPLRVYYNTEYTQISFLFAIISHFNTQCLCLYLRSEENVAAAGAEFSSAHRIGVGCKLA
jgi:hypothetical protein